MCIFRRTGARSPKRVGTSWRKAYAGILRFINANSALFSRSFINSNGFTRRFQCRSHR